MARASGVCALLFAAAYLVIVALYASVAAPPKGGAAWLDHGAGKTNAWWGIVGLSVLTDLLLIPVGMSLLDTLRPVQRDGARLGVAFVALFVVLDLAVTWPNFAALVSLSADQASATGTQQAANLGAATYASSVLTSTLWGVYSIVTLSIGILLLGAVLLRGGPFGRVTGWLGVVTGALGVLAVAGPIVSSAFSSVIIVTSLLTMVWVLLVGVGLLRSDRSPAT